MASINRQRLLQRFLRYVRIDTTADPTTDRYPSSDGQWELGRLLVQELRDIGLDDVVHDEFGLIYATVPSSRDDCAGPVVALNAHLDTSPETSGAGVQPQVIENYSGADIMLPGAADLSIRVAEHPELQPLVGATLVTTDGTTLLGGDDKAGVAILMELAAFWTENATVLHGPVRLLFTCDEEIGRGVQHVDLQRLGAEAAYTLDGGGANEIDVETFSADLATVTFQGVNIHPAIAKDRMVNAVRAVGAFLDQLPRNRLAPETTADREGFLHPYAVAGGVGEVKLQILLRDFDTAALRDQEQLLRETAQAISARFSGLNIDVAVQPQYRNLGEGLRQAPHVVEYAAAAHRRLGREPRRAIIRGGTDGSQLTARGLPTPNLSSGQHNLHSRLEWACLDEMVQAAEIVVELLTIWAEER